MTNIKNTSELILSRNKFDKFEVGILEALIKKAKTLRRENVTSIIPDRLTLRSDSIQKSLQNVVLLFITEYLKDDQISDEEQGDIEYLKLLFKIEEGDFSKFKDIEVGINKLIEIQLLRMYADKEIDDKEEQHKIRIQKIFSLGYDEFLGKAFKFEKKLIKEGIDPLKLDTFITKRIIDKIKNGIL